MNKYKVGQTVIIIDNKHGHGYNIGDRIKILSANPFNYRGPNGWCFEDSEIKRTTIILPTNIKVL